MASYTRVLLVALLKVWRIPLMKVMKGGFNGFPPNTSVMFLDDHLGAM